MNDKILSISFSLDIDSTDFSVKRIHSLTQTTSFTIIIYNIINTSVSHINPLSANLEKIQPKDPFRIHKFVLCS
jgi:hypothetical protein